MAKRLNDLTILKQFETQKFVLHKQTSYECPGHLLGQFCRGKVTTNKS